MKTYIINNQEDLDKFSDSYGVYIEGNAVINITELAIIGRLKADGYIKVNGGGIKAKRCLAGGDIKVDGDIEVSGKIQACGYIITTIEAGGGIFAGGYIKVNGDIEANGGIFADGDIEVSGLIKTGGSVKTSGSIEAGRYVEADGKIQAGGYIKVNAWIIASDSIEACTWIFAGSFIQVGGSIDAGGPIEVIAGGITCGEHIKCKGLLKFKHNLFAGVSPVDCNMGKSSKEVICGKLDGNVVYGDVTETGLPWANPTDVTINGITYVPKETK